MKALGFLVAFLVAGLFGFGWATYLTHSQARAERIHGIRFPPSTKHIENRSAGLIVGQKAVGDGGYLTFCQMSPDDVCSFTQQLRIEVEVVPESNRGDPSKNGWNVWPRSPGRTVPVDLPSGGSRWRIQCVPLKALTCKSPTGDFLIVELWDARDRMIVKVYTDWN